MARGSRTIQDAIAFDAQQTTGADLCHPSQKRGTGVPAVSDDDRAQPLFEQQEDHLAQLTGGYPGGHILGGDALGIQHKGGLPWLFGQQYDAGNHQARTDGVVALGQIGDRHQGAIGQRFGSLPVQVAGIDSHKDRLTPTREWSKLEKDLTQLLAINLAIFQCLVQAGPLALKERGLRQLGKAVGSRFTREGIHRVEQCIPRSLEASVDRVTKLLQRVNVHRENAPPCFVVYGNITPSGDPSQVGDCLSLL